MSQIYKSGSGGGGTPIETIDGDVGSVTGATIQFYANHGSANAGASVSFTAASATEMDLALNDTAGMFLGSNAGNGSVSGTENLGLGVNALNALTTGQDNVALGMSCAGSLTTGENNTLIGFGVANNLTTGVLNIVIGSQAADNYTSSESSNIVISNQGVTGESNVIRIGTQGSSQNEQDECFIAGIVGVTVSNAVPVTIDSTTGQLGVAAIPSAGISSIVRQVFTTTGTYTPTAGMVYCDIQVVGGGGGGGGQAASAAGNVAAAGGGGGGYAQGIFSAASIGASKAVTIGAGGAGGAAGGANTGATGGTSSVGILITATGGTGGGGATFTATSGTSNQPGQGGSGTLGDFQTTGSPGTFGFWLGPGPAIVFPGTGGSSFFGGGAYSVNSGAAGGGAAGINGTSYGGGGSGGWDNYDGRNEAGGNGAAGIVIVTEYVG